MLGAEVYLLHRLLQEPSRFWESPGSHSRVQCLLGPLPASLCRRQLPDLLGPILGYHGV